MICDARSDCCHTTPNTCSSPLVRRSWCARSGRCGGACARGACRRSARPLSTRSLMRASSRRHPQHDHLHTRPSCAWHAGVKPVTCIHIYYSPAGAKWTRPSPVCTPVLFRQGAVDICEGMGALVACYWALVLQNRCFRARLTLPRICICDGCAPVHNLTFSCLYGTALRRWRRKLHRRAARHTVLRASLRRARTNAETAGHPLRGRSPPVA